MRYAVKGKELREETPLGIASVEQRRHFLEERGRRQETELVRQRGDGREGNSARRERNEEAVAFVERRPRCCPYC